jgi:hypothetical protein
VFATALISYAHRGGCYRDEHKDETIVIDYFFYIDA